MSRDAQRHDLISLSLDLTISDSEFSDHDTPDSFSSNEHDDNYYNTWGCDEEGPEESSQAGPDVLFAFEPGGREDRPMHRRRSDFQREGAGNQCKSSEMPKLRQKWGGGHHVMFPPDFKVGGGLSPSIIGLPPPPIFGRDGFGPSGLSPSNPTPSLPPIKNFWRRH